MLVIKLAYAFKTDADLAIQEQDSRYGVSDLESQTLSSPTQRLPEAPALI